MDAGARKGENSKIKAGGCPPPARTEHCHLVGVSALHSPPMADKAVTLSNTGAPQKLRLKSRG